MTQDTDIGERARRLNDLRQRVLAGQDVAPEEYREIIEDLRATRRTAAAPAPKAKPASEPFDPDMLFRTTGGPAGLPKL